MSRIEISSGLVVRNNRLLMVFDNEKQSWSVPSVNNVKGEICADAAKRATEEVTSCSSQVVRYQGDLKTSFRRDEEEVVWQPYMMDIEGEPDKGEWVPVSEMDSKELSNHLRNAKEKIMEKF